CAREFGSIGLFRFFALW
nr:immunoglobulin heavy chain junction region [Macaca mulatta]